jgi:hypothetical protein
MTRGQTDRGDGPGEGHERAFLGTGWAFPVGTDSQGRIELVAAETDIEASVRVILGTAKGERLMRPDFGCGIHDYVFSTVNTATLTLVETAVEEALVAWEPRIDVTEVTASAADLDKGRLSISVDYTVRSTNTPANLVYPFYIEGER